MDTVAIRISQHEFEYLQSIAEKIALFKNEGESLSVGKALKELLKWCVNHGIDITKKQDGIDDELRKMIEQIHVSIPNIIYHLRIQSLMDSNKFNEQEIEPYKKSTVKYMNETCGDFQNVTYKNIRISMSNSGIKRIPIDEDKSLWK